jgi:hypothetical protein
MTGLSQRQKNGHAKSCPARFSHTTVKIDPFPAGGSKAPRALEQPRKRKGRTLLRLLAVLVLSLVLHALVIGTIRLPHFQDEAQPPLEATIVETPPAPLAEPPPPKAVPKPQVPHHSPAPPAPAPPAPDVIATDAGPGMVIGTPAEPAAKDTAEAGENPGPVAAPSAPLAPAPMAAKPVNQTLNYDVVALDPKQPNQSFVGNGVLTYRADASGYRATLEARVALLFISLKVLSSESSGMLGADGLEPSHYSETPRNKPTVATLIARDANGLPGAVTSSQGSDSSMAQAGVQDHLSLLFQLGGLLAANPAWREAQARFAIPVAGLKGNVETWNFLVLGHDAVSTPAGRRDAIHVTRVLRAGTNDRGIDVWISTEPIGLPLRVRYTEPGGASIDLVLASASPG